MLTASSETPQPPAAQASELAAARRTPSRGWLVALSFLFALASYQWHRPLLVGIDPSWHLGLHLWARGAADGQPIEWTYGPLGFLTSPDNWVRITALLAVGIAVLARTAFVFLVLRALILRGTVLTGVLGLWLLLVLASMAGGVEILELLPLAWAAFRLDRGVAPTLVLGLLEGGYAGGVMLVKPGSALVVVAVLVLLDLAVVTSWRARLAWCAAFGPAAVAITVIGWVLAGQPLARLGTWLHASVTLTGGYGAMALEARGRDADYRWALVGALAVLVLWLAARGPRRAYGLVLTFAFLYLQFKHAFVRHDGHATFFFIALLLALLLAPVGDPTGARRDRWQRTAQVVSVQAFTLVLLSVSGIPALGGPLGNAASFVGEARVLVSGHSWNAEKRASQSEMRKKYALSPAVRSALVGETVQVDPWAAGVVWAYHLRWHPIPVFQEYSAYTPWLDEQNAVAVEGPQAPSRILRSMTVASIDGRYGLFDSPRYQLEVACRYREVARDARWQVLANGSSQCGQPVLLATAPVRLGSPIAVPAASSPDSAIVARVVIDRSLSDRLLDLAFKSPKKPLICLMGKCHRFVTATAAGPLLIAKASWMPAGPGRDADEPVTSLTLRNLPGTATVEFYEVPRRVA